MIRGNGETFWKHLAIAVSPLGSAISLFGMGFLEYVSVIDSGSAYSCVMRGCKKYWGTMHWLKSWEHRTCLWVQLVHPFNILGLKQTGVQALEVPPTTAFFLINLQHIHQGWLAEFRHLPNSLAAKVAFLAINGYPVEGHVNRRVCHVQNSTWQLTA